MKVSLPFFLFLLFVSPLWALSTDREQSIEVEADSLEVREQDNISIYQGNVKLVQGSLQIHSDKLVIHFNQQGDLELMEMTGNPARFRQLDDDQLEMLGQAQQINYQESKDLLELKQKARFSHDGDVIESDSIIINTVDNRIQAGSENSDERVKMLIKPKQTP